MRKNHTPYLLYRFKRWLNHFYIQRFILPQFDSCGANLSILKPHKLSIFGHHINVGNNLHIICDSEKSVRLSTWNSKQQQGNIDIGHNVLISPGVSISSAEKIRIGNNCMIAAEVYISDSDWHHIYNRTRPFRCSKAIILDENVWLGFRSVITKGVHIGKNSVVAAGSVVVEDVPDNTVVGGNPARAIKNIDPQKKMITREFLFQQAKNYDENQDKLHEYLLDKNSWSKFFKSKVKPTNKD